MGKRVISIPDQFYEQVKRVNLFNLDLYCLTLGLSSGQTFMLGQDCWLQEAAKVITMSGREEEIA